MDSETKCLTVWVQIQTKSKLKITISRDADFDDLCGAVIDKEGLVAPYSRSNLEVKCDDYVDKSALVREKVDKSWGTAERPFVLILNTAIQEAKRRRLNANIDIGHLDTKTNAYFKNLPEFLPNTVEELQMYLSNTPVHKFEISRCEFETYRGTDWENAISNASTVVEDGCVGMEQLLAHLTSYFQGAASIESENSMQYIIDVNMQAIVVFYGCSYHRNVQSQSSGAKRPDYFVAPYGPPLFVGEDKMFSKYKKGVYGSDPVLENELKTPWNSWKNIYGDIPYIFAYSAIGDGGERKSKSSIQFTLGVLELMKKKFSPLRTFNLLERSDIPELWETFMKLLPVFKSLAILSRKTTQCKVPYEVEKITDLHWGKNVTIIKKISCIENCAVFQKCWQFDTENEAEAFMNNQKQVFEKLDSLNSPYFIRQSKVYPFHRKISNVKVCFSPFGERVCITTSNDLLSAVLSISKTVSLMHSVGIVHNDIRWDNVIVYNSNYILIDFDDAFILSENMTCPGLPHLREENHPRQIYQSHGVEVDVWAIGKLIVTASLVEKDLELKTLGLTIVESYTEMKLSSVIDHLKTLQKNV